MNFFKSYADFWHRLLRSVTMLALILGGQASLAVQAQTNAAPVMALDTLHLSVISANDSDALGVTQGAPLTQFKYIINVDNTGTTEQRSPADGCSPSLPNGDPDPSYPESCHWVSVAGRANHSPIITQGNQDDFPGGTLTIDGSIVSLPAGRYLISILADGYKIDGEHFTVPGSGDVTVEMQPYDLPTATIQAAVFEDMAPTNSAPDLPIERGLAGFRAHINDYIDEVTTDVFGNPLGAEYDPGTGEYIPGTGGVVLSKCYVVANGVDIGTVNPVDSFGRCPIAFTTAEDPLLGANITSTNEGDAIPAGAAIEGKAIIPNVGPNRYALSVVPPNKTGWIQTTTLEGNHDWDAWVMEGATGLDTEFVVASEPFPATFFGFVPYKDGIPTNTMAPGGTNTIKGRGVAINAYIPPKGGLISGEGVRGGQPKDGNPIPNPVRRLFVSLSDLNANDQTVFVKEFGCEANPALDCNIPPEFEITGIPDGDYVLGVWDEPQDYIFDFRNVSVQGGEIDDVGDVSLLGWWTPIDGYVFNDLNENGMRDNGEPGIPNFFITMRNRENSLMDRGSPSTATDANGYYWLESAYPMNQWQIIEAYADGLHTTGITYWADNNLDAQGNPIKTTVLGAGVDVNVLPEFSQSGHLDWGVKAYDPGENGGIVGTVSYDTTRNELNPQYAAIEDWQPSISDLNVNLYAPVPCGTTPNAACDANGLYELAQDGSYALGPLLNQYLTETWERPSGCVARDLDGVPLVHGVDEKALPYDPNAPCLEAPMNGVQFGPMQTDQGTPEANFGATVDGNYGFGDGCYLADGVTPGLYDPDIQDCVTGSLQALPSNRDYLVKVEIPDDEFGRPLYQVTREEDINVAAGDSFVPQVPPPSCAGALHSVDVEGIDAQGDPQFLENGDPNPAFDGDGYPAMDLFGNGAVIVPASTPVNNPPFVGMGGTIYEGQQKPLCDMKLVRLADRKSIAPGFNFFTDVPLPGRFWGLIVDDLNWSSNPQSLLYGEKMGVPFAPVGIYDYTNRLITTVESDYNGLFDVLLPSTNRISCPTPSGVCANLYRFVGNDPGTPGKWNANFNPQYRTISAEFEAFPGLTIPADLAPTQVAVYVQLPGGQTLAPISCTLNDMTGNTPAVTPEFFAIDKPWMRPGDAARTFTLQGLGFGNTPGTIQLDNFVMTVSPAANWADTSITFTVPSSGPQVPGTGTHQLKITTADGKSTVNALTFHVAPSSVSVFEVGPGRTYSTIQAAIDAAAAQSTYRNSLVVVYPGAVDNTNPRYNGRGAYYENPIMYAPVQLQGVGPGGVRPNGTVVNGSIIDGIAFGGDTTLAANWLAKVGTLAWDGNQDINDGQVIYVLASNSGRATLTRAGSFNSTTFKPMIDGFNIRGGDQQGIPPNLTEIAGALNPNANLPVQVVTQGGAIFANAYVRNLQITNNVIESNGGAYGTIRIGTPNISDQNNDSLRIANNRILANGGTNLAGAIGLFNGADSYEISGNDFCGNFSAEYGGAISHFGYSPNGKIHDNRVYFNRSYDEGAGIMIAGELATDPNANYGQPGGPQGSGPVDIYNNLIQANLANDDGGGLRFLMAGNFAMNVYNNMIVNNVSTHEGGGVALDDASNVRFYNNTVMNNKTTATAITSDGDPAPAGLSTGPNSAALQASLPGGSPTFSDPLLFNNIFHNNWAGSNTGSIVTGISSGDANPWDMGSLSAGVLLSPTNSVLETSTGIIPSATNTATDPGVVTTYDIPMTFTNWGAFVTTTMVTVELPPSLMGDYHIQPGSPAYNWAANSKAGVNAPAFDIDNQFRPSLGKDSGADEITGIVPAEFPATGVLDDFERGTGNVALGSNWGGALSQNQAAYRINTFNSSRQVQVRSVGGAGLIYWNQTSFGPTQEAYFTFTDVSTLANEQDLILKRTGASTAMIEVLYDHSNTRVEVWTLDNTNGWQLRATFPGITFASGDQFGARTLPDGTVVAYKDGVSIGTINVTSGPNPWPTSLAQGGGQIGVWFVNTSGTTAGDAHFDNFGGGTLP